MVFGWMKRRGMTPELADAVPATDPAPPIVPRSAWQRFTEGLAVALDATDNGIARIAIPFGVLVREPRKRCFVAILNGRRGCAKYWRRSETV